ncbi:MAG TPA: hypothetical protein PKA31_01905 [Candidatus Moranbacteria bacterium]|nr:hypothetical protein [Candidatus Moranbacteria bacterium]
MESLHSQELSGQSGGASTQRYVDVEEVRDGVMVLKNGSLRAVLLVSSVNFDLKSSEEQDLIISQYQNFLNSLDFPIQIVVSSRKLNITPYLEYLKKQESKIANELLRFQLSEYQLFIKNLAEVSNIMRKFFYIVVPFYPAENVKAGLLDKLFIGKTPGQSQARRRELFETYKHQLAQRVDQVSAALAPTGVRLTQLNTEELIELMYNSYNPTTHSTTIIKDVDKVELR